MRTYALQAYRNTEREIPPTVVTRHPRRREKTQLGGAGRSRTLRPFLPASYLTRAVEARTWERSTRLNPTSPGSSLFPRSASETHRLSSRDRESTAGCARSPPERPETGRNRRRCPKLRAGHELWVRMPGVLLSALETLANLPSWQPPLGIGIAAGASREPFLPTFSGPSMIALLSRPFRAVQIS